MKLNSPHAAVGGSGVKRSEPTEAAVPETSKSIITTTVGKVPGWMIALLAALALTALAGILLWLRARRRQDTVQILATEDPITGFAKRDAFDRRLAEEWRRAFTFGSPLGLMSLELDGFAEHADSTTEAQLADTLLEIAQVMRAQLRATDLMARPSVGEFAVICPETDIEQLVDLRTQLEQAFEADERMNWEVNVGVAELESTDGSPDELVARARDALYSRQRAHKLALVG